MKRKHSIYIEKAKKYLEPALRQYIENDESAGFIAAYDLDKTIELMANMIEFANLCMSNSDNAL